MSNYTCISPKTLCFTQANPPKPIHPSHSTQDVLLKRLVNSTGSWWACWSHWPMQSTIGHSLSWDKFILNRRWWAWMGQTLLSWKDARTCSSGLKSHVVSHMDPYLSLLIFLIFVNDLPGAIIKSTFNLYADDTMPTRITRKRQTWSMMTLTRLDRA